MQTEIPKELKYTREHEWIGPAGDGTYRVGITAYAAEQLGDVTYVELPKPGKSVEQGKSVAAVESVKAASDIYAPVAGRVAEVNAELEEAPEKVNQSPYEEGWFFTLADVVENQLDGLMTAEQYEEFLEEQEA